MREHIKNFLIRMLTGMALILALNFGFRQAGLALMVGINPVTAVAAGALGVPGVIMLYGIAGCN